MLLVSQNNAFDQYLKYIIPLIFEFSQNRVDTPFLYQFAFIALIERFFISILLRYSKCEVKSIEARDVTLNIGPQELFGKFL